MGKQNLENKIPEDKLDLYDRLIKTNPEIERKGRTMPYTSINGYMFTHLSADGKLGIRLSQSGREVFISKYNSCLYVQHGIVMKEFVEVPDELFSKTSELKQYLDESYEYTKSLKPKSTKKFVKS